MQITHMRTISGANDHRNKRERLAIARVAPLPHDSRVVVSLSHAPLPHAHFTAMGLVCPALFMRPSPREHTSRLAAPRIDSLLAPR